LWLISFKNESKFLNIGFLYKSFLLKARQKKYWIKRSHIRRLLILKALMIDENIFLKQNIHWVISRIRITHKAVHVTKVIPEITLIIENLSIIGHQSLELLTGHWVLIIIPLFLALFNNLRALTFLLCLQWLFF